MKNLKFYYIFILTLISCFTHAQDYSFVINEMYSEDASIYKLVLQEAAEEYGKASLIIEFKSNAEEIEFLEEEKDEALRNFDSDFIQNNTNPDDNTYCIKAKSLTNKLSSLDKQLGQVGTMVSLAKTSYGLCANNAYRTTNCEQELSNWKTQENRYNNLVSEYNQISKTQEYNVNKCNSHISNYETKAKEADRKYDALADSYSFKIRSLRERQSVISDELVSIMDNRPYLSETRYPNGNIESTGIRLFGKGNANGTWKYYYESGELKQISEWLDGSANGSMINYYENRQLENIGEYSDGKANGSWKSYYKNGVLKSEEKYTLGNRNGLCKYYHENGKLKAMGMIKDEEQIGVWKFYDENGEFKEDVKF
jgi:antitoxin component YwqK of YwqJK toxin-antitoxin module